MQEKGLAPKVMCRFHGRQAPPKGNRQPLPHEPLPPPTCPRSCIHMWNPTRLSCRQRSATRASPAAGSRVCVRTGREHQRGAALAWRWLYEKGGISHHHLTTHLPRRTTVLPHCTLSCLQHELHALLHCRGPVGVGLKGREHQHRRPSQRLQQLLVPLQGQRMRSIVLLGQSRPTACCVACYALRFCLWCAHDCFSELCHPCDATFCQAHRGTARERS